MRLLNIHTLELEEFTDEDLPPYAIASHRWGRTSEEATHKDVIRRQQKQKPGYQKILSFCKFVKDCQMDIDWIWIDTCCIDKRNLVELSEAINSMYRWYSESAICIALLHDVYQEVYVGPESLQLSNSEWFKRGWTLQELLAPLTIVFADSAWRYVGAKITTGTPPWLRLMYSDSVSQGYVDELSKASGISHEVLTGEFPLSSVAMEQKMSWMDSRNTTRTEDRAYCLLGMFGVFLAPIYGERQYAMVRLKQAIAASSGQGDTVQAQEPRVPSSWAMKYQKQAAISLPPREANRKSIDVAKDVPALKSGRAALSSPGKAVRTASQDIRASEDLRRPRSSNKVLGENLGKDTLSDNAAEHEEPRDIGEDSKQPQGLQDDPPQNTNVTRPTVVAHSAEEPERRWEPENTSHAEPYKRLTPEQRPTADSYAPKSASHQHAARSRTVFETNEGMYVTHEARVRNRYGVAVGKVVLTKSDMERLLGCEVDSDGKVWANGELAGIAMPYVLGGEYEETRQPATSLRDLFATEGVSVHKESSKKRRLAPTFKSLRGLHVVHEGRVRDDRGVAVGRVVETNVGWTDNLVGCDVDVRGRVTKDGNLVALAAAYQDRYGDEKVDEQLRAELARLRPPPVSRSSKARPRPGLTSQHQLRPQHQSMETPAPSRPSWLPPHQTMETSAPSRPSWLPPHQTMETSAPSRPSWLDYDSSGFVASDSYQRKEMLPYTSDSTRVDYNGNRDQSATSGNLRRKFKNFFSGL